MALVCPLILSCQGFGAQNQVDARDPEPVAPLPKLGPPQDVDLYLPTPEDLKEAEDLAKELNKKPKEPASRKEVLARENQLSEKETPLRIESVARPLSPEDVLKPTTPSSKRLDELKTQLDPRRPLHQKLRKVLKYLEENDVRAAYRVLKNLDGESLVPQDRFLLQGLQAYIYFRLGDDLTTVKLVDKLLGDLKDTLPLVIKKNILVTGPLTRVRFGRYEERPEAAYRRSDKLYLYVELENAKQKQDGNFWSTSMKVDFSLEDSKGHLVSDMRDFDEMCNKHDTLKNNRNRNYRRDVYKAFIIDLPKNVNPGHYTLKLKITDLNRASRDPAESSVTFAME